MQNVSLSQCLSNVTKRFLFRNVYQTLWKSFSFSTFMKHCKRRYLAHLINSGPILGNLRPNSKRWPHKTWFFFLNEKKKKKSDWKWSFLPSFFQSLCVHPSDSVCLLRIKTFRIKLHTYSGLSLIRENEQNHRFPFLPFFPSLCLHASNFLCLLWINTLTLSPNLKWFF